MVINGTPSTFWELIENNPNGIVIPRIQRDYVQGRKSPKIKFSLDRLLNDIKLTLTGGGSIDLNYVYGVNNSDGAFVPIDGQQRLTTLLCLHLYAFAREGKKDELRKLGIIFSYQTRISTGRFLQNTAKHLEEYFTSTANQSITAFVKNSPWYQPSWDYDPSIDSFLTVLDKMQDYFEDIMNLAGILLDKSRCPISFMQLMVDEMGDSDVQYVKMNSRGKQLTDFETFKSELFEVIDDNILGTQDFKGKIDGDWMNMIWRKCKSYYSAKYFNPKVCDRLYMLLLHHIIVNAVESTNYNKARALKGNKGFYNFSDYENFIKSSNGKILKDIYYTMQCLCYLLEGAPDLFQKLTFMSVTGNWEEKTSLSLFVFVKYATEVPENQWSVESFRKWHRITTNIINNCYRDEKSVVTVRNRFATLPPQSLTDIYIYLKDYAVTVRKDFGGDHQMPEEILKSKLICANPNWENQLIKAESDSYFKGEIAFVLKLQGIAENNIKFDTKDIILFLNNWERIKEIFKNKTSAEDIAGRVTLRRLLLCFDNYEYLDRNYGDSKNVDRLIHFYCYDKDQHFNSDWRGLLRNQYRDTNNPNYDGFTVFKKMFDAFILSGKDFSAFCAETLHSYSNNPSFRTSNREELKYYLITNEELFNYIDYGGIIWQLGENQYYILATRNRMRGVNYKLYALYDKKTMQLREFKNSSDPENYITYKGHKIRYDTKTDNYTVDNSLVINNGIPIRWVDEMRDYIKKNIN